MTKNLDRLPGLKFMRTLWVCNVAGGPQEYTATKPGKTTAGLEEAHRDLRISPAEFDEVAAELGRTLDFLKVPKREKAARPPAQAKPLEAGWMTHLRVSTSARGDVGRRDDRDRRVSEEQEDAPVKGAAPDPGQPRASAESRT
jgi:hypothetical protein